MNYLVRMNDTQAAIRTATRQPTKLLRQNPSEKADFQTLAEGRQLGRNRGVLHIYVTLNAGDIRVIKSRHDARFSYLTGRANNAQIGGPHAQTDL